MRESEISGGRITGQFESEFGGGQVRGDLEYVTTLAGGRMVTAWVPMETNWYLTPIPYTAELSAKCSSGPTRQQASLHYALFRLSAVFLQQHHHYKAEKYSRLLVFSYGIELFNTKLALEKCRFLLQTHDRGAILSHD